MAELDYAFVADFARVEPNGTLTSIGASWTFLEAKELPAVHRMAVAGRIRARVEEGEIGVRIDVRGPNDLFNIAATGMVGGRTGARPYGDGLVGHLFALDLQIPLPTEGTYIINVELDGEQVRRLAFEVTRAPEDA